MRKDRPLTIPLPRSHELPLSPGALTGPPSLTCSGLQSDEELARGQCELGARTVIKGFQPPDGAGAVGMYSFLIHLAVWMEVR